MLTFLRRLRLSLLESGSTRPYLLYAIGEILLVVLGILIALQINNWNEERKNRIEERDVLSNLTLEFSDNQTLLDSIQLMHADMAIRLRTLSSLIGPEPQPLAIQSLDSLMLAVINNPVYKPVSNTLSTLTSTGKSDLIKDKKVKDLIHDWTNSLHDYDNSIKYTADHYFSYISQFVIDNYQIKNLGLDVDSKEYQPSEFAIDSKSILSSPQFENYVELRRANSEQQLRLSKQLSEIQLDIINRIDVLIK